MPISTVIFSLARLLAGLGGLCLCVLTVMTVASVTGRELALLGLGPIPGDFELVEAGMTFAVFAFLPWCHLQRGNVSVEIFTSGLGPRFNRVIDVISESLMLAFALLIAWRHFLGMLDKRAYGETTFILQFPIWWAYAAGMVGAAVFVIVALYCFIRSWVALLTGDRNTTVAGTGH
jgi:TRAP-type C4-dicarboxylate transport system permease small subunit